MDNKKKRRHLVCNAHIDPIWQWDLPEGVSATLSTFYSAAKLCDEFDYIFCHNEVTVYKYVEEYAPALFEKIKELVKKGKWHIMGGWYLQPDCNMPCGESFVRQIREGQRYFREKFGAMPTTAINLDPFGHSVGLVQIVKKCGQDSYLFMRPWSHELSLPCDHFIWRGLDGSEIKAVRITGGYNTPLGKSAESLHHKTKWQPYDSGVALWGVGNHGGGPSRKDLADIKEQLLSNTETEFFHSTPEAFFSEIQPKDVFDKSLRISMPGCYTSMYRVKKLHAQLEAELAMAEKISTVACVTGMLDAYPEEEIKTAVEDLLGAEFHDVLPGTSVQCGEDAGIRYLNHGLLEAERAKVKSYFALSKMQPPAKEGEYPVVVFNPQPYELCENVECEFSLADQNWNEDIYSRITVLDKDGNSVPYQVIKEESNLTLDWRKRIMFEARLKPMSLARYSVYVSLEPTEKKAREECFVFDNGRKYVEIDKNTGLLKSYKIEGQEYLSDGFGLYSFDDNADPWGMGKNQLLRMGTNERAFALSREPRGVFEGMKSVQVIEDGDIYLGVEAFFECDSTRARILYKIYKNNDSVDIDVTLFMGDINRIIKLRTPFATEGTLIGQTAFGTEELYTDGRENVAGRFVALDTGKGCLALLNRGVYGGHFENGSLYTSLVRGVTYCAHPIGDRELIPSDRFTKKIDQGENNFSFRLTVAKRGQLERKATEFSCPAFALNIFPIPCEQACAQGLDVRVGGDVISMPTAKKMYKEDAYIFRLLNNTDTAEKSYIEVGNARLDLTFGRYEVKTVVYKNGTLKEEYELLV